MDLTQAIINNEKRAQIWWASGGKNNTDSGIVVEEVLRLAKVGASSAGPMLVDELEPGQESLHIDAASYAELPGI